MEYFDFEGTIPAKQYGAGDVIVWDWGTWEPEAETPDPARAIQDGELKFRAHGTRVRGRFTMVRTSRRPGTAPRTAFEDDEGEQWLLIKKRDGYASAGWDAEDHPTSVKSGRTNDEVKANAPAVWVSSAPAATAEIDLAGAREAPLPRYLEPMLATLATKPFRDEDWLFEVKWDGYRVEAVVRKDKVSIFTRNGHDAETYFPRLLTPTDLDRGRGGDRRRRGGRARRARPPRLQPAPGADQRGPHGPAGPARLPGVRPAPPRRPVAARRPPRAAQEAPRARGQAHVAGPGRALHRHGGRGVLRGREGPATRGDRREAQAQPLRARPPEQRLAQDQGAARAGAGRGRLDARRGQRQGAGRRGGRRVRGGPASVRRQGRVRLRRPGEEGAPGAPRRPRHGRAAVRPAATQGLQGALGRRPGGRPLDPAGARDPGRDRRLDPRPPRPPDRVQGHRARARPARRGQGAGRRPGDRGTRRRGHVARPRAGCA